MSKYFKISNKIRLIINDAAEEVGIDPIDALDIYQGFFSYIGNMFRRSEYYTVDIPGFGKIKPSLSGLKNHEAYLRWSVHKNRSERTLNNLEKFQKYRNRALLEMLERKNKEKNEETLKERIREFYRFPYTITDGQLQIEGNIDVGKGLLLRTGEEKQTGWRRWARNRGNVR